MLQRKQSLFMFFAFLISAGYYMYNVSLVGFDAFEKEYLLNVFLISSVFIFVNIFLYKKRKLQLYLNYIIVVFHVLYMVYSFVKSYSDNVIYMGVVCFVMSVLLMFANFFIIKDVNLLKHLDRLR